MASDDASEPAYPLPLRTKSSTQRCVFAAHGKQKARCGSSRVGSIWSMDTAAFWAIMGGSQHPEDLHKALNVLSDADLAAWETHYEEQWARTYTWDLWGAAYVIAGGCSDDSFDYFRAWLLSRGQAVVAQALSDADSLADVDVADEEEWEDWMSPTMAVVHARTGSYAYVNDSPALRQPPEPAGDEWDEEQLPQRCPRLGSKFGFA
jgi:hypothetical protein